LLNWKEESIGKLDRLQPFYLYGLYGPLAHLKQGDWERLPPEYQEMLSIIEYMRIAQVQVPTIHLAEDELWEARISVPFEVQRDWPIPKPEEKDWRKLLDPSPACVFYRYLTHPGGGRNYSLLHFVKFDSFRRLGFAFWSSERMTAYGLYVPLNPQKKKSTYDCLYYAWQSLLSEGEIAEVEDQCRRK